MDPILAYLTDGTLPPYSTEADCVKRRTNWFTLYNEILYKQSYD